MRKGGEGRIRHTHTHRQRDRDRERERKRGRERVFPTTCLLLKCLPRLGKGCIEARS